MSATATLTVAEAACLDVIRSGSASTSFVALRAKLPLKQASASLAKLTSAGLITRGDRYRWETTERLSADALYEQLIAVDARLGSKDWRTRFDSGKASLAANLGFLSANQNLDAARFFLDNAMVRTEAAQETAARAFLICVAFAAISLDYAMRDWSFRSVEERYEGLRLGLRYGEGSNTSTLDAIRLAIGLVRQYGNAVAKQVEARFSEDASRIPVEMIAEFVSKISAKDTLFKVARELDRLGHTATAYKYDDMSSEAKSFLGVLIDFFGGQRRRVADLFPLPSSLNQRRSDRKPEATADVPELPLQPNEPSS